MLLVFLCVDAVLWHPWTVRCWRPKVCLWCFEASWVRVRRHDVLYQVRTHAHTQPQWASECRPLISHPLVRLIESSLGSVATKLNFFIHNLAQMKFTGADDRAALSFAPRVHTVRSDGTIRSLYVCKHIRASAKGYVSNCRRSCDLVRQPTSPQPYSFSTAVLREYWCGGVLKEYWCVLACACSPLWWRWSGMASRRHSWFRGPLRSFRSCTTNWGCSSPLAHCQGTHSVTLSVITWHSWISNYCLFIQVLNH